MKTRKILLVAAPLFAACFAVWTAGAHEGEHHSPGGNGQPDGAPLSAMADTRCVGGKAGTFPCNKIDLAALLPTADIDGTTAGGVIANDIWGWTDALTDREYALLGLSNGVAFVDVTNPTAPAYLGNLPRHNADSLWRSLKVYRDHLYVVSEAAGHGLQVFDLRQLRNVAAPPQTFAETAHYNNFGSAHTVAVNEETGFLYVAGSRPSPGRTPNADTCPGETATRGGGLHVIDVRDPAAPAFAGCVNEDGYTHETQCVVYRGPDAQHWGREVCFSANEDTLTIVDVTNKQAPAQLSRTGYVGKGYTHQAWLTGDHARLLLNDELDEQGQAKPGQPLPKTRTFVWDVSDLDAPFVQNVHLHETTAIDHNLYVRGLFAFESNYRSGVRIMDVRNAAAAGALSEAGFFDVYPSDDQALFNGTWGNYPFFASGTFVASGMEQGLFVLRPHAELGLPVRIDYEPYFVRQQYRDFLSREPDGAGLGFWTHEVESCMGDAACREVKRVNVSGAFFLSIEFQETGYPVYLAHKAAYGDLPGKPVPLRRETMVSEAQQLGQNVVVNQGDWQSQLQQNKRAYFDAFAASARFADAYPQSLSAEQFVDALDQNAGGALSTAERGALVAGLAQGTLTRAQVLRAVAEDEDFKRAEFNRAFVLMQYFGYLRRNPDDAPEPGLNFDGYNFWLGKLDQFGGDFQAAEMVKAFISSAEYRQRFGN
ncbi:MAG TPA: choice-of-anchor B family protein [Pyrinomonadaceae bacterium]|jgi:choice-of-anchor B domain-containing protein